MTLKLIVGDKNYSSWSFRPWIAMRVSGIPFEDVVIPFGHPIGNPEFKQRLRPYTPAGKVPVLIDGSVHIWETLAILEYLAEKFPAAALWPADVAARAHARVVSNEMHAGFGALRSECPMNMRRPVKARVVSDEVKANVARIDELWSDCRARFGAGGPFLFGRFCAADAMYAPVVSRFHTYGIAVGREAKSYMEVMMALPAWAEWKAAGVNERRIVPEDEADWPTVL